MLQELFLGHALGQLRSTQKRLKFGLTLSAHALHGALFSLFCLSCAVEASRGTVNPSIPIITMTTRAASVFDQLLCPDTIADRLKGSAALQALPTRSNKSDRYPRHVSVDLREADGKIELEMEAALARKKPSKPKPRAVAPNH